MNLNARGIHAASNAIGKSRQTALSRSFPSSGFKCDPVNTLRQLRGASAGRSATVSRQAGNPVGIRVTDDIAAGHLGATAITQSDSYRRAKQMA
jgi:hypothetical protein